MSYALQTLVNALTAGSIYALVAIGVALVFSVMRLVNFAHAGFLVLGGYLLVATSEWSPWLWVPLVIAACVALAVLMDLIAFRPLRHADMMTLLVASYSVGIVIQAIASTIGGTRPLSIAMPAVLSETYKVGGLTISFLTLLTIGVSAVCLVGLMLVLTRTRLGLEMRATSTDLQMTKLLGVRTNRVIVASFVLSGAIAAVASILLIAQSSSVFPTFGFDYVIIAFIACVLGGMGSIYGAVVGGLTLGALMAVLNAVLPLGMVGYRDALVYAVVILILLVRPQGIFGQTLREA